MNGDKGKSKASPGGDVREIGDNGVDAEANVDWKV